MWAKFIVSSVDEVTPERRAEGWDENRLFGPRFEEKYLVLGMSIVYGRSSEILVNLNSKWSHVEAKWYPLEFFDIETTRAIPSRWLFGTAGKTIDFGLTPVNSLNIGYPQLVLDSQEVSNLYNVEPDAVIRASDFARTELTRQTVRDAIETFEQAKNDVTELAAWAAAAIDEMDKYHLGLDAELIDLLVDLTKIDESANPKGEADRIWRRL